ncbi:alpha/beta fold hydrolase [Pseudoalteromonas piscicida]|uniref:alpha/beta fold hydrolase n=1 Tax=Pseudoalteromonas piscicida TaxID=43662 RepID=UPI000E35AE4C|nr:alpha/beta fold hydrolase [Pseudoalteromonas piscicida]AXR00276.1 alpha/beta fold hydrolase [Pseudoalteromonas piscicida]
MKFSYFNDKDGSLITKVSRGVTGLMCTLAPPITSRLGQVLLMSPHGKRQYQFKNKKPNGEFNILTSLGRVHVNVFGLGPKTVVLSHGWADNSSCFDTLIPELVAAGFCVVAIDHVGHGQSHGKRAHLLAFVEALDTLIEKLEADRHDIVALVGHSMGAVALMNLPDYRLENRVVINVATPVQFFELMFERVARAGISEKMLHQVLGAITTRYGTHWHLIRDKFHDGVLKFKPTFIHDTEDRFAPFEHVASLIAAAPERLIQTSGLGHRRILGDTGVIQRITQRITA